MPVYVVRLVHYQTRKPPGAMLHEGTGVEVGCYSDGHVVLRIVIPVYVIYKGMFS